MARHEQNGVPAIPEGALEEPSRSKNKESSRPPPTILVEKITPGRKGGRKPCPLHTKSQQKEGGSKGEKSLGGKKTNQISHGGNG